MLIRENVKNVNRSQYHLFYYQVKCYRIERFWKNCSLRDEVYIKIGGNTEEICRKKACR